MLTLKNFEIKLLTRVAFIVWRNSEKKFLFKSASNVAAVNDFDLSIL